MFFPRLHQIFASRPNVTPIVITTALGPQGRKTVWYQPPDGNDTAPPAAVSASQPAPPSTPARGPSTPAHGPSTPAHDSSPPAHVPSHTFGTDVTRNIINLSTPDVSSTSPSKTAMLPPSLSGKRGPKPSAVLREAIDRARSYIEKVPQKRTLIDTLLEMQEYVPTTRINCICRICP